MDSQVVMPSWFSGIVLAMPLTPKMIDLIQKSSSLNGVFGSQPMPQDRDVRHRLMQLAKKIGFHCNDILLRQ